MFNQPQANPINQQQNHQNQQQQGTFGFQPNVFSSNGVNSNGVNSAPFPQPQPDFNQMFNSIMLGQQGMNSAIADVKLEFRNSIKQLHEDTDSKFKLVEEEFQKQRSDISKLFTTYNEVKQGKFINNRKTEVLHCTHWPVDTDHEPVDVSDMEDFPDEFFELCIGVVRGVDGFKLECKEGIRSYALGVYMATNMETIRSIEAFQYLDIRSKKWANVDEKETPFWTEVKDWRTLAAQGKHKKVNFSRV